VTALEDLGWSAIDVALRSRRFQLAGTTGGEVSYRGQIPSGKTQIDVTVSIRDPLFTRGPKLYLDDPAVRSRLSAHLNTDGSLCYAEGETEEYDLYNSGGAVLTVLESARATLDQVLHAKATTELEREFVAYWKGDTTLHYADLPPDFSGRARGYAWGDHGVVITTKARASLWTRDTAVTGGEMMVIRTTRALNSALNGGAGGTLASFKAWAGQFVDDGAVLDVALNPVGIENRRIILIAENGMVSARFRIPPLLAKAYAKSSPQRRGLAIAKKADNVIMERGNVETISLRDIVSARLTEPSPLIGKSIAVIGAGAIGSRVALELVRCGAGLGSRPMLVVDRDIYLPQNFGRHVLPITDVHRPKATALTDMIKAMHPDVSVEDITSDVLDVVPRLQDYDLVVDATGSNPLALRLNHTAMASRRSGKKFPPILHAAVHGNGLAVQTILATGPPHACLKCLRPEHGLYKADPLKPGVTTDFVAATCGDGAHVNYAAPAPILATALTIQAALDWAKSPETPGPRVRTRVLDLENTQAPKDKSWPAQPGCPACAGAVA
jgi:molybdopterin/thiamine biosynthesis adenylyltransferase